MAIESSILLIIDNSLIFAGKEGGQQMLKGIYFDEREETEE